MLILAVALASAAPTDTWHMGGGRAWMRPPKLGRDRELQDAIDRLGRPTTLKEEWDKIAREVEQVRIKARNGDVESMRLIGFLLLNGVWMKQDQPAAVGWFYEAAIRDDPLSMFVLGCAFQYGVGVTADQQLATFWRRRAAEHRFLGLCQ